MALLHTWPLATDPLHLSRLDNDDAALHTWVIAWVAHRCRETRCGSSRPRSFYPEHDALAYSEHMWCPP